MAYRLRRGESVARAVPRIAKKQIDKAMAALAGDDPHRAVHDARTAIKRLRGLLRLVHPGLGRRGRKDTRKLRDVADGLGQLRDAEVMVQTFDRLWDLFEAELGITVRRARMRLVTRLRSVETALDRPARLRQAMRGFRKLRKRVRRWQPSPVGKRGGWDAIQQGLCQTYAQGRRWFRRAHDSDDDHAFHQWRKHVKYHGYHLQLLAELAPDELDGRGKALTRLGELLGEDHDLAVFRATLATEPRAFDSATDRRRLLACITTRQKTLRAEAVPLGERLYAEPPRVFRQRLARYWDAWRREATPPKVEEREIPSAPPSSNGMTAPGPAH